MYFVEKNWLKNFQQKLILLVGLTISPLCPPDAGANTGIGKTTAMELARRGARVIMACRDRQRAEAAIQDIVQVKSRDQEEKAARRSPLDLLLLLSTSIFSFCLLLLLLCLCQQETGNQQVVFMLLDLASLKSVRSFAENFLQSESRLDLLINNAGELSQHSETLKNKF